MEITKAATITDYKWNGTTYYQLDGKGKSYLSYGLADRARRNK